ncbi:MAG: BrnA antitoxin family protein [Candidatus Omnitrophica bacterium]|nr:BrnA antitoxin family protein [Candidatus Omnitrophota bacterium]MBU1367009.1 BrnA antitoxin family protein [Candidatus Omnitrophota bacterium]MBU1524306.1 BrnA antitoxin family protein [Candidatus Omnitrophota bacterium]MBU1809730.1 BrnA antitoxin family protein [Candidatus Omnitrophota bacterium]MBU2436634.1 BrnA antitoxin family protein [Candidatus Omnitrophota bacterium]
MAKNKVPKIPDFKNDTEAAAFWDTHDSTTYLSQTKPAHLVFPKPRHKIVIELRQKQWETLQRLAHQKNTSFNHLLEKIVSEKLAS